MHFWETLRESRSDISHSTQGNFASSTVQSSDSLKVFRYSFAEAILIFFNRFKSDFILV